MTCRRNREATIFLLTLEARSWKSGRARMWSAISATPSNLPSMLLLYAGMPTRTPTPVAAGKKSSDTMQRESDWAMLWISEKIRTQNLYHTAVGQDAVFGGQAAGVVLQLKGEVKTGPVATQLQPGEAAVVVGVDT